MKVSFLFSVLSQIVVCCFLIMIPRPVAAQYQTLGQGSCGGDKSTCHKSEFGNMVDKHKNSVDDLSTSDDAKKYAELAGVGAANMLKGTSKCMTCHGTVISGKEGAEVEDGVSCEGCHGPGSGYKDPHSEGTGGGLNRPGYIKSLKLGLKEMKNLNVRAEACVRCHLTTDQKILASGHPTGLKFNYISNLKPVAKHWKHPLSEEDKTKKPFDDAIKARGPIAPVVEMKQAEKPKPSTTPGPGPAPVSPAPVGDVAIEKPVARPQPIQPITPIAANTITTPVSVGPITLEPFPQLSDTASVDSILLVVKKRLELLYQKTNPSSRK